MSNDLLVCVDTNVLVALIDSRDKWHEQAVLLLDLLREIDARLVYFDCVINETVGVMGRRTEEQKRSEQFTALLDVLMTTVPIDLINWISADLQGLYHRVLDLCRDHGGKLNFNDSLIALACQDADIRYILSFDRDFDDLDWLTRVAGRSDITSLADPVDDPR